MFIGRTQELRTLERLYQSEKFEFAVIYGRRRVGKTALMREFIRDKNAIFFTGVETSEKQNLENLSKCIYEYETGMAGDAVFSGFQSALEHVFVRSQGEKLILVMDEYPYVARANKSLASTLQLLIDKYKDSSKLMLILCGSSMSYMEDHVLAYKAPLYGRRTAQLKIEPFEFAEACVHLQGFGKEEKAFLYGMIGGTPQYLLQIHTHESVEENVKRLFLDSSSAIYEETMNLLKQEMREPAIYHAIITAVAGGANKLSEISNRVGEETSACSAYIKNLIALGIIKKEVPYGESGSRKTIYSIADHMFCFWYRFVPGNEALISRGAADLVYKRIEPYFSEYMGAVFEELCKQYLWQQCLQGKCTVAFRDIGRWWGTNPNTKMQEEIDIMGEEDKNTALFAECKWTTKPVDETVLEKLIARSELFSYRTKQYYLFSKSGFSAECISMANAIGNVKLVCYDEMFGGC